jgi:hypothetical protein
MSGDALKNQSQTDWERLEQLADEQIDLQHNPK